MRRPFLTALAVLLAGCLRAAPAPSPAPLELAVDRSAAFERALQAEEDGAQALLAAREEALWRHWTIGAPLELKASRPLAEGLLDAGIPALAARSRSLGDLQASRVRALLRVWNGERLARALGDADRRVESLEASLLVRAGAREVKWRDLVRAVSAEPSAVTRRELWAARAEAVPPLLEAMRERARLGAEVWADAGVGAILAEPPAALAEAAALALDDADAGWPAAVQATLAAQLKLPMGQLSRVDLLRFAQPSPDEDRALPEPQVAALLTSAAGVLGLQGRSGVTLELGPSPKKHPLPLAVAPGGASDVRVCARPAPGLGPLRLALRELGRAAVWAQLPAGTRRWQAELDAEAGAALAESLMAEPAWLERGGVAPRAAAIIAARSAFLSTLEVRRLAASCLVGLAAGAGGEDAARATWRLAFPKAFGLPAEEVDAALWRLDADPLLGEAAKLRGALRARAWRAALGSGWWERPWVAPWRTPAAAPASTLDAGSAAADAG